MRVLNKGERKYKRFYYKRHFEKERAFINK